MSEQLLRSISSARPSEQTIVGKPVAIDDAETLIHAANEQLARDLADIEHASAVLRNAKPALQTWSRPAVPIAVKVRPLWLIIGILWISTAIVTVGAAVAIAALAG
jgi:hypothetical protein